ncbi:acyl-CoA dehydrogenase family protein [Aeromicrobium choanae]|uniref:Acyl-[acyl-carrier-protein] dehydrogenase MbtN n=1 Tax=Aeromicrobium choanae TaxID=1736691 RepID=A0A1T4YX56_9ACTN|nr:acyl-CoA dehydrogenase family protein [Aeromicrobium choanae]SKB06138.1 acyl-CoA dehydrogenase [Aeromicrobium choanae]
MRLSLYDQEHEDFRSMIRTYLRDEVVPAYPQWEADGLVPRSFFERLGELGVMGLTIPEQFGGSGEPSYRFGAIISEEVSAAVVATGPLRCHLDVVLPYFLAYADEQQQERWFPGFASGHLLTAVAMTEPGTGSDLSGIRTRARREGDTYVLNGAKTFITGGMLADLTIVVARTSDEENPRQGLSLLVVESGSPGFTRTGPMQKLGMHVQDTAELSFDDVRVPVANLLGEEGRAFEYLGNNLPKERLGIAVTAVANSRAAIELTKSYVRERQVFGKPVASFQNTRFELASVTTEIDAAQLMVDHGIVELDAGRLSAVDAAKIKLFATEAQGRCLDRCLQLFGGYGYIAEYPISRLYADARVTRIYGGTSEVMRTIIAKSLGI